MRYLSSGCKTFFGDQVENYRMPGSSQDYCLEKVAMATSWPARSSGKCRDLLGILLTGTLEVRMKDTANVIWKGPLSRVKQAPIGLGKSRFPWAQPRREP